jgi:hypothetical protein
VLAAVVVGAGLYFESIKPLRERPRVVVPPEPQELEIEFLGLGLLENSLTTYEVMAEIHNPSERQLPAPSCRFIANARQGAEIEWDSNDPIAGYERVVRRGVMTFGRVIKNVGVDEFKCSDAELDPF